MTISTVMVVRLESSGGGTRFVVGLVGNGFAERIDEFFRIGGLLCCDVLDLIVDRLGRHMFQQ